MGKNNKKVQVVRRVGWLVEAMPEQ